MPIASSKDQSDFQKRVGTAVQLWRNRLGITQEELGWRANLHRSYIADIERGGRNITLRSISKLAVALQVPMSNLFFSQQQLFALHRPNEMQNFSAAPGEILLIEDNPVDVELTLLMFRRANLSNPVKVARDGQEALDTLFDPGNQPGRPPQLVLLDLLLPKVPGIEVLRRLKSNPATRSIPVVILTGTTQDSNMIECARLGAENYLIKPMTFASLSLVTPRLNLHWALVDPLAAGGAARTG